MTSKRLWLDLIGRLGAGMIATLISANASADSVSCWVNSPLGSLGDREYSMDCWEGDENEDYYASAAARTVYRPNPLRTGVEVNLIWGTVAQAFGYAGGQALSTCTATDDRRDGQWFRDTSGCFGPGGTILTSAVEFGVADDDPAFPE